MIKFKYMQYLNVQVTILKRSKVDSFWDVGDLLASSSHSKQQADTMRHTTTDSLVSPTPILFSQCRYTLASFYNSKIIEIHNRDGKIQSMYRNTDCGGRH